MVFPAGDVEADTWRQLRDIQQQAWSEQFSGRSPEEVEFAINGSGGPMNYLETHLDPNKAVGRGLNANQLFTVAKVAIAYEDEEPVGFLYTANNASGGGPPEGPHNDSFMANALRVGKLVSVAKNYLWVREMAVAPEHQRKGIGTSLGQAALYRALSIQPVAAYVWPYEEAGATGGIKRTLEYLGFAETDREELPLFGPDSRPATQVRMEARSVRLVRRRLNSMSEVKNK